MANLPTMNVQVSAQPDEKLRRRSQRRRQFTASVLVFEPKSETLLRARTSDLASDGCFVDTLNPLAKGTMVKVRIEKKGACFESWAKVVYSLESMGMGLAFESVGPEQLWVLHEWMNEANGTLPRATEPSDIRLPAVEDLPPGDFSAQGPKKRDAHWQALHELIKELMSRGVVSEEKGNDILQKLGRCTESE